VSAGIYVAGPAVRRHIAPGRPVDMPELIMALIRAGVPVNGYRFGGDWHDIGTPETYAQAQRSLHENSHVYLDLGNHRRRPAGRRIDARTGTVDGDHGGGDHLAEGRVMTATDVRHHDIRRIVAREMGDVLVRPPLAPTEDFFRCGGDSLRAVELISRLIARWHPSDGEPADHLRGALLLAMFDDATLEVLAEVIERHARGEA